MMELDGAAETIFVDDGSSDCSSIVLRSKAKDDSRYRYLALSRNFGHQVAISAGMDAVQGDAVIVMDADMQDPPEVIGQVIECWKQGYQVVYGRRLWRTKARAASSAGPQACSISCSGICHLRRQRGWSVATNVI
jgi:polyisoprenyl-phosphate glycosyltransferase